MAPLGRRLGELAAPPRAPLVPRSARPRPPAPRCVQAAALPLCREAGRVCLLMGVGALTARPTSPAGEVDGARRWQAAWQLPATVALVHLTARHAPEPLLGAGLVALMGARLLTCGRDPAASEAHDVVRLSLGVLLGTGAQWLFWRLHGDTLGPRLAFACLASVRVLIDVTRDAMAAKRRLDPATFFGHTFGRVLDVTPLVAACALTP